MWGKRLFLSLPFDPDLNESWFKLWHVNTNLKDALGTGNRAASRRSGFKKSQIVKTSWSKFFVFQSSLSDFAPTARPRDARSKSRQVSWVVIISSRSRHWRVWKRGLQGVSVILSTPGTTETRNCITGTFNFFFCHLRTRNEISPGLDTQIRAARKALKRIVLVRFHQLLVSLETLWCLEEHCWECNTSLRSAVEVLEWVRCTVPRSLSTMNSRSLSAKLKSTTVFYRLWHVGRDWQKGLRRVLQTPTLDSIWIDALAVPGSKGSNLVTSRAGWQYQMWSTQRFLTQKNTVSWTCNTGFVTFQTPFYHFLNQFGHDFVIILSSSHRQAQQQTQTSAPLMQRAGARTRCSTELTPTIFGPETMKPWNCGEDCDSDGYADART